jgi:hypothetical protein
LRSLCAPCVTKTPQRGKKTRKLFPHNSRQNKKKAADAVASAAFTYEKKTFRNTN